MDIVTEDKFDKAKNLPAVSNPNKPTAIKELSNKEFKKLLDEMQNPVNPQQKLAVQVKHYLDNRIAAELNKNGVLSDSTRRWVEVYNNILDKIQKSLYGDKSVNLHVHKVSHSDIATKIRNVTPNGTK